MSTADKQNHNLDCMEQVCGCSQSALKISTSDYPSNPPSSLSYTKTNYVYNTTFLLALKSFSRIPVSENIQSHNYLHTSESTPILE